MARQGRVGDRVKDAEVRENDILKGPGVEEASREPLEADL